MKAPTPIGWRSALRSRLDKSSQPATAPPTTIPPSLLATFDGAQLLLLARLVREQRDPLTAGTLPTELIRV